MRIVHDGFWWDTGPPSGRMIVRELTAAWIDAFPDDEMILAVPRGTDNLVPPSPQVSIVHTFARRHPLINVVELPRLRRRFQADHILSHNFASPSQFAAVFVQDVLFQTNAEWFSRSERAYFSLIPRLFPTTGLILASSETEASRISRANPRLRRPIEVCGLGVSRSLANAGAGRCPLPGLTPHQFFLSVGRLNVRKNLAGAIRGLLDSGRVSRECPIVVVGAPSGREARPDKIVEGAVERGLVRYTGHISDEELVWLYRNCLLFIFLSLDEGYGLPPVEALSLGARVLASDIPVFHETLGAHAVFADPRSESSVASGVHRALGTTLVSQFDGPQWTRVAERIRRALSGVPSHDD